MISFRYHIVSIVSVFLALAVGVALGGGPLQGEVDNTLVDQVKADRQTKANLQDQIRSLRNTSAFDDDFARTVVPQVLGGELDGRVVTVVELPDAKESDVTAVRDLVAKAGGSVGGTVRAGKSLLDAGNKQLVDELGGQLLDGAKDVSVSKDAGAYERIGALIARAVGTSEKGGATLDGTANSILSGLSTASLMSADGDLSRRGSLVVVVTGPGSGTSEQTQGANTIVTSIAQAVDAATDGVVVAGPTGAAHQDGLIQAVRGDVSVAKEVSTVDSVDTVAGQVTTVLALAEQAGGDAGQYGAVDPPDGAMPGAQTSG